MRFGIAYKYNTIKIEEGRRIEAFRRFCSPSFFMQKYVICMLLVIGVRFMGPMFCYAYITMYID